MNSSTKLATGLALACTWTTAAQAEDYRLEFVSNVDISAIRLHTNRELSSGETDEQTLSDLLGPVVANETYTYNVSTSYATSATGLEPGDYARLNLVGTFEDGDIAVAGYVNSSDSPFENVPAPQAVSGILSGNLSVIADLLRPIYTGDGSYSNFGTYVSRETSLGSSVTLYRFDASGARTEIGTITAQQGLGTQRLPGAVPEPATLAALGLGGLALLRRRRSA